MSTYFTFSKQLLQSCTLGTSRKGVLCFCRPGVPHSGLAAFHSIIALKSAETEWQDAVQDVRCGKASSRQNMAKHGKTLQNMAKHGKTWQNMAKHGKTLQNMAKHGKTWQNMAKHGKTLQNMAKHGKTWQNMAKHGKTWQNMAKQPATWSTGRSRQSHHFNVIKSEYRSEGTSQLSNDKSHEVIVVHAGKGKDRSTNLGGSFSFHSPSVRGLAQIGHCHCW